MWVCRSACVSDKCDVRRSMNRSRHSARCAHWNTRFWVSMPLQRIQVLDDTCPQVGRSSRVGSHPWAKRVENRFESSEFASRCRKCP
jgi:hypothetical protein